MDLTIEYVSINELISNINNVFAKISNEIIYESFLYFQDNEKYIQKGISFWQNFKAYILL